jgi:ABC-2 type transport system ATP-binding protein
MLKINGLSKKFKNHVILKNINIECDYGKVYGFVGPNGCGKSVFFKIVSGFLKADSGEISIDDKVIGKDLDFLPNLGVLIEKPGFIENYNHLQNLKYLASINNIIDDGQIKEYLKLVGLDIKNTDKVKNYSLGMRQRLGIAQAIMENQKIIILDEPFNGLDKDGTNQIKKIILNLKNEGKLILLTSHIEGDIEEMSDVKYQFNESTVKPL